MIAMQKSCKSSHKKWKNLHVKCDRTSLSSPPPASISDRNCAFRFQWLWFMSWRCTCTFMIEKIILHWCTIITDAHQATINKQNIKIYDDGPWEFFSGVDAGITSRIRVICTLLGWAFVESFEGCLKHQSLGAGTMDINWWFPSLFTSQAKAILKKLIISLKPTKIVFAPNVMSRQEN